MRSIVVGAVTAVLSVGLLFAYNKSKQARVLERQRVLTIVKKIKQDMYTILFDISNFVQEHSQQIPPQQLRKVVMSSQSSLAQTLTNKLQSIYLEHQTSEQQFEDNITHYYKGDHQIQYHINKYRQLYEKALLGIQPPFKEDAATFISKENVLKTVQQILQDKLEAIVQQIGNASDSKELKAILQSDKKQEQVRRKARILKQFGLISKQNQLCQIFEFCVAKYIRMGGEFAQNYGAILASYESKYTQAILNQIQKLKGLGTD